VISAIPDRLNRWTRRSVGNVKRVRWDKEQKYWSPCSRLPSRRCHPRKLSKRRKRRGSIMRTWTSGGTPRTPQHSPSSPRRKPSTGLSRPPCCRSGTSCARRKPWKRSEAILDPVHLYNFVICLVLILACVWSLRVYDPTDLFIVFTDILLYCTWTSFCKIALKFGLKNPLYKE